MRRKLHGYRQAQWVHQRKVEINDMNESNGMKGKALTLLLALAAAPTWSANIPAPETIDQVVACADLKDAQQRLECYDRGIAPLKNDHAAAAPATPAPAAARKLPAPGSLGEEQLRADRRPANPDRPSEPQALHARIATLSKAGYSYLVGLDNGQVWYHENLREGAFLKEGEAVTIEKGALGSYRLIRDDDRKNNWIRVKRAR
jgi:hypothetical protein